MDFISTNNVPSKPELGFGGQIAGIPIFQKIHWTIKRQISIFTGKSYRFIKNFSWNQVHPFTAVIYLNIIKKKLNENEKFHLDTLVSQHARIQNAPTKEEIIKCFKGMDIDFLNTSMSELIKAIKDRTPSLYDVNIVAQKINEKAQIDVATIQVPQFNRPNYLQEFQNWITGTQMPTDKFKALIFSNPQITSLQDLSALTSLTKLILDNCSSLTSLSVLPTSLTTLKVRNCTALTFLNLSYLPSLTTLKVRNCTALTFLNLSALTSLTKLILDNCSSLTSLSVLPTSLTTLKVRNCTALTLLNLSYLPVLNTISVLGSIALTQLDIQGFNKLSDLGVDQCTVLTHS